ncbi:hypothetical protein VSR68_37890 [Paraburkholderia phymatum]|uniref:hypothetical protein n=1 Tax=Paraburkholderia phymatum TaxID=148447 RepID=UPI0031743B06
MQTERPPINLDQPGRLFIADLLVILRIARPTLYKGLAAGRYPAADGKDNKRPYWLTGSIKAYLAAPATGPASKGE